MTTTLSRRTVTAGLAWAAPAVAVATAAPAFAASRPCSTAAGSLLTYTGGNATGTAASITGAVAGSITAVRTASAVGLENSSFKYVNGTGTLVSGKSTQYPPFANLGTTAVCGVSGALALSMLVPTADLGQTVTLTFAQPISYASFSILDFDQNFGRVYNSTIKQYQNWGYRDQVTVSTMGATITATTTDATIAVTGSGTTSVTAQNNVDNTVRTNLPTSGCAPGGAGVVNYTVCGSFTSLTIDYRNPFNNNNTTLVNNYLDQQVYLSPLTVKTACVCG